MSNIRFSPEYMTGVFEHLRYLPLHTHDAVSTMDDHYKKALSDVLEQRLHDPVVRHFLNLGYLKEQNQESSFNLLELLAGISAHLLVENRMLKEKVIEHALQSPYPPPLYVPKGAEIL